MSIPLKASFLFLIPTAIGWTILSYGAETLLTEEGKFVAEDTSIIYYFVTFIGALGSFILILWKYNKWLMKELLNEKDKAIEQRDEIIEGQIDIIHELSEKPKKKKRR